MKRFFTTLFLLCAFLVAGQTGLKISQLPRTNALGPNQLFVVTAGNTNMGVSNAVMPDAIQAIKRMDGRATNLNVYSVGDGTTNLTIHIDDQATRGQSNIFKIVDDQSGLELVTIDNDGSLFLQGGTQSGNGGASLWASNATFRGALNAANTPTLAQSNAATPLKILGAGGTGVSSNAGTYTVAAEPSHSGRMVGWIPSAPTRLIFEGDSLSVGDTVMSNWTTWATNTLFTNANCVFATNACVGGHLASNMFWGQYTNEIQRFAPAGGSNAVLFFWAGINDLQTYTASEIFESVSNEWSAALRDGFEVCAFTVTDSYSITNGARRLDLNRMIRAATNWTYLVDLAAELPIPSSTSSDGWYFDGVHFTGNANRWIAWRVNEVLRQGPGMLRALDADMKVNPKAQNVWQSAQRFAAKDYIANRSVRYVLGVTNSTAPQIQFEHTGGSFMNLGISSTGEGIVYYKGTTGNWASSNYVAMFTNDILVLPQGKLHVGPLPVDYTHLTDGALTVGSNMVLKTALAEPTISGTNNGTMWASNNTLFWTWTAGGTTTNTVKIAGP